MKDLEARLERNPLVHFGLYFGFYQIIYVLALLLSYVFDHSIDLFDSWMTLTLLGVIMFLPGKWLGDWIERISQ
jgi:hypothetical protein